MVEYKGDKSERSFLSKRVLQNLRYHIKAKVGRRPSIVKILAIFIVFIIALKLLSTLDINITVHYGEPDSGSIHAVKEHNKVKPPVDEVRPLQPRAVKVPPPPRDIPNPQKANPAVRDRVHAFTGPQNESLIYLDYIDRNLPWDKKEEEESKKTYKLNKYLSDRLPLNRNTEDLRHPTCAQRTYQYEMPTASIVLVFYNEAPSVVLRTVFTILEESDPRLIHEILLYDDCSTHDELKEPFERHIAGNPKIKLVRAQQRGGLVKARLYASRHATGEVLLYLDAHCEPTPGWLEPLLEPIAKDRTTITLPSLDVLAWETLEYSGSDTIWVIGGVNWLMNMLWMPIPGRETKRREAEDPYPITANLRTATMAGGLFAMDRLYFKEMGEYDEGMGVWGGENMELSFRVWMCGGSLLFVPCSKVGHIFRPSHPYDFMGGNTDIVAHNYVRAARVWFDDEIELFYKLRPQFRNLDVGDLSKRYELRKSLKCNNYAWFIKNVFPELPLERDLIGAGRFMNDDGFCMDTRGQDLSFGSTLRLYHCSLSSPPVGQSQNTAMFMMFTKWNTLMGLNYCIDSGFARAVRFENCHNNQINHGSQFFTYEKASRQILQNDKCIEGDTKTHEVVLDDCVDEKKSQKWTFEWNYLM